MNIKLIRNSENGVFSSIDNGLVLQMVDDNYKFLNFTGKRLYVLNSSTNEKYEIAPGVKKYLIADISYAHRNHDYVYFTSAELLTEHKAEIIIYRFLIDDNSCDIVYRFEKDVNEGDIMGDGFIKIFTLDKNFFVIEEIGHDGTFKNILLYDINAGKNINLEGSLAEKYGIYKVISLEGNNCVIKYGASREFKDNTQATQNEKEIIGIINTNQFVSEMMLNPKEITMEELEVSDEITTFPYIKRSENRIIYSKFNMETMSEEIVLYDFENKVKQIRINTDILEKADISYTYIINDNPYSLKKTDKHIYIVNLNTQKVEFKFPHECDIKFIKNDFVVVTRLRHKIPLFKKGSDYIEVYKLPDIHHALFKKKATYNECMINGEDLLIFTF